MQDSLRDTDPAGTLRRLILSLSPEISDFLGETQDIRGPDVILWEAAHSPRGCNLQVGPIQIDSEACRALGALATESDGWWITPELLAELSPPKGHAREIKDGLVFVELDEWHGFIERMASGWLRSIQKPLASGHPPDPGLLITPAAWAQLREGWSTECVLIGSSGFYDVLPGRPPRDLVMRLWRIPYSATPEDALEHPTMAVPVSPSMEDFFRAFEQLSTGPAKYSPPAYWIVNEEEGASIYRPQLLPSRSWVAVPTRCDILDLSQAGGGPPFLGHIILQEDLKQMAQDLDELQQNPES